MTAARCCRNADFNHQLLQRINPVIQKNHFLPKFPLFM